MPARVAGKARRRKIIVWRALSVVSVKGSTGGNRRGDAQALPPRLGSQEFPEQLLKKMEGKLGDNQSWAATCSLEAPSARKREGIMTDGLTIPDNARQAEPQHSSDA